MTDTNTLKAIWTSVLGGIPCNTKDITLWEHYVNKGGFSLSDFRDFLYKSPEFTTRCETLYNNRISAFQLENDTRLGFPAFWLSLNGVYDDVENAINGFICNSDAFVEKTSSLIRDVFSYEINAVPSDAHLKFYLEKFAFDTTYDTISLSADIVKGSHVKSDENVMEHLHITPLIADRKPAPFDIDRLDAFEAVFQRPMFVQEYFKYQTQYFDELLSTHNSNYNRLREIFETYTGKTISEYYYVHKFLFSVDDDGFFEKIVDDIVNSAEYRVGMSRILVDKYAAMFDSPLSDVDAEYIFAIVKKQKLDIVNERLATILTNLKEETDTIIGAIFKVYDKVLNRPPDMNEIEQYVGYYRSGGSDVELEKVLMRTLEFHDSIKKHIRSEYHALKGKDVLPSILFDVLNRIIVRIADLEMDTIDETIRTYL